MADEPDTFEALLDRVRGMDNAGLYRHSAVACRCGACFCGMAEPEVAQGVVCASFHAG